MLTNTKVLENHSPLTLYTDISFTTSCESNKKHNKQQFEKSFKRGNLVYSILAVSPPRFQPAVGTKRASMTTGNIVSISIQYERYPRVSVGQQGQ